MNKHLAPAVVFACAALVSGCSGDSSTGDETPVSGSEGPGLQTSAMIAALQREGLAVQGVELMLPSAFPFFAVRAFRSVAEGENVYAFEYATVGEVETAVSGISADGFEIGRTQVSWISDPHLYRSDRLIVLYVGRSGTILRVLERVVGPQIAGR